MCASPLSLKSEMKRTVSRIPSILFSNIRFGKLRDDFRCRKHSYVKKPKQDTCFGCSKFGLCGDLDMRDG